MHRFEAPCRVGGPCEIAEFGFGFYVLDASGLVLAAVTFREPDGLGFALLERDEAEAMAATIARLMTVELAQKPN